MYKISALLIGFIIFISCTSSKNSVMDKSANSLSGNEKSDGWKSLFDGKTTNGWHTYGKQNVGNEWKVEDGVIHLDASTKDAEHGDLVTNDEYGNFDLKLDWKISEKGNSGIIF